MKPVIHVQGDIAYFNCPACGCMHGPKISGPHSWGWNGDAVRPTFTPSILVRGTKPVTDDEVERIMAGEKIAPIPTVCHSHVRSGMIEFGSDCTHELAGKTVPLDAWE